MHIPGYSQGEPVPADRPRHAYGALDTLHQTGTVDIQVNRQTGEIIRVWFRCLNLPFSVECVDDSDYYNPAGKIAIETVTYADLP
jgi:hypothetical protein